MSLGLATAPPIPVAEIFARQRYAVVPQMISPAQAALLAAHMEKSHAGGMTNLADAQVPQTPCLYGDQELERLLATLGRKMEFLTGLQLHPTYSFARLYKQGDTLAAHRDRAACEISISLNLGQIPNEPWPLYLRDSGGAVFAAILNPGDALLYRGMELTHWREPYGGERVAQVFLHYVDRNGPCAGEKFDRRQGLGLPPTPRFRGDMASLRPAALR